MNSKVRNIKTELLSDHWYTLNNINFDYQLQNGNWVNQSRESYDRGNGATILLYNIEKQTVILIEQFYFVILTAKQKQYGLNHKGIILFLGFMQS